MVEEFLAEYEIVSKDTGHHLSEALARQTIENVIAARMRWVDGLDSLPSPLSGTTVGHTESTNDR